MSSTAKSTEEEYKQTFKIGSVVEISSDDEGLRGSWYTATVIRTLSPSTHKILVEYHNLFADDLGSKKLREFVDAILVRPIPPRDPTRVFRVMDDVDAFHNDGWWEGVVTHVNVLEGSGRRYSVFFRCSREQIEFSPSDLRLHREWVRANHWVPPLDFHYSSSSGQKRKNGEDRKNGGHPAGGYGQKMRKGEVREVGRRNVNSPSKQGGGGGGVVMKNGGGMHSSNRLVSVAVRKNQMVCGVRSKSELTRNGTLKEPRRRATSHTGGSVSRK